MLGTVVTVITSLVPAACLIHSCEGYTHIWRIPSLVYDYIINLPNPKEFYFSKTLMKHLYIVWGRGMRIRNMTYKEI